MNGAKLNPAENALAEAFARRLELKGGLSEDQTVFLGQISEDLAAEELPQASPETLAELFASLWNFAVAAPGEPPAIRLRRWGGADGQDYGRDLLEIVQDDKPFLVDSLMNEIAEAGMAVRAMFHPVVTIDGRTRSMIQVHLDPVGEDRSEGLIAALQAVLADVRVAVADYDAMLDRMRRTIEELEVAPQAADPEQRQEELAFLRWLAGENFVLLGARVYDYPRKADGGYAAEEPLYQPEGSLGVLRDPERTVLRRGSSEPAVLSQADPHSASRSRPGGDGGQVQRPQSRSTVAATWTMSG